MSTQRERFEAWAVAPPREWGIELEPDGKYFMCVQSAWEAWQAACPEGWQCVPKEPAEIEHIIANSGLNDRDEVAIQSFLVDFNTHPNPVEFEATGINGYFQWWRANKSAATEPEDHPSR